MQGPPDDVAECQRDRPDGDDADEAADDTDRADQSEDQRHGSEHERPGPLRSEPEQSVGEGGRRGRDHEQLEDRPADRLHDVDDRGQSGAAPSERSAHQHHGGHAGLRADRGRGGEHRLPDRTADRDRDQRIGERQRRDEIRARDEDEQRDAEIAPEQAGVEKAEHAQPPGHRIDSPGRAIVGHDGKG